MRINQVKEFRPPEEVKVQIFLYVVVRFLFIRLLKIIQVKEFVAELVVQHSMDLGGICAAGGGEGGRGRGPGHGRERAAREGGAATRAGAATEALASHGPCETSA